MTAPVAKIRATPAARARTPPGRVLAVRRRFQRMCNCGANVQPVRGPLPVLRLAGAPRAAVAAGRRSRSSRSSSPSPWRGSPGRLVGVVGARDARVPVEGEERRPRALHRRPVRAGGARVRGDPQGASGGRQACYMLGASYKALALPSDSYLPLVRKSVTLDPASSSSELPRDRGTRPRPPRLRARVRAEGRQVPQRERARRGTRRGGRDADAEPDLSAALDALLRAARADRRHPTSRCASRRPASGSSGRCGRSCIRPTFVNSLREPRWRSRTPRSPTACPPSGSRSRGRG